jgi:hypothetical protein
MEPAAAGKILIEKLRETKEPLTVADASARSGLALRDAEAGLTYLTAEYRGHLRVTEDGDLIYLFPTRFEKPWETKEAWERALAKVGAALVGAGRFVIRAWILIAMVAYALLFVALLIGLSMAGNNRRDDRGPGAGLIGVLFRAIADAVFWTARPFSPVYMIPIGYGDDDSWGRSQQRRQATRRDQEEVPFYERVNRFVFGPKQPPPDPLVTRANILAAIRNGKGRIGLSDVMRVTGLPRDQADPLMARLMLDQNGTVEVSDAGGIYYVFPEMRRTAAESWNGLPFPPRGPSAAWDTPKTVPPLTGNSAGNNFAIAALNAFNLFASLFVIGQGLTLSNILLLYATRRQPVPVVLPNDGMPIALGLVPLLFSILIFLMPAFRALKNKLAEGAVKKENARLQIMKEVLTHASKKEYVTDEALRDKIRIATGHEPSSREVTKEVVALGGDVEPGPEGQIRYRFADLEAEAEALEEERAHAPEKEARVGKVVFSSEN